MEETVKEQDTAAFPPNTGVNGSQQELPEEEPISAATSINVEQSRNARDTRKMESTLSAQRITQLKDEFMTGIAPDAHAAAGQREPAEQKVKTLQSQRLSSILDEPTSGELIRFILEKELHHIERLEELEKQSMEPSKDWDRSMQVLISIIALLQKNETSQRLIDAQVQARTPIPEPQLSEEAQRVAKFSKLDQALIREALEKSIILRKRKREELDRLKPC